MKSLMDLMTKEEGGITKVCVKINLAKYEACNKVLKVAELFLTFNYIF